MLEGSPCLLLDCGALTAIPEGGKIKRKPPKPGARHEQPKLCAVGRRRPVGETPVLHTVETRRNGCGDEAFSADQTAASRSRSGPKAAPRSAAPAKKIDGGHHESAAH